MLRDLALPHPKRGQPTLRVHALVALSPGQARSDAQLRTTHITRLEDVVYSMPLARPVDPAAGRKGQAEPRVTAFSLREWMQTARGPRIGHFTRLWGGQLRALVGLDEAGRLIGHTLEDLVLIDPATLRPISQQPTGGAIEAIARVGGPSVAIVPARSEVESLTVLDWS